MPNKELVVVLPIHVFILSLFLGTSPKWINEEQKFSWKEIVRWSSRRALSWGDSLDTFRRRSSVSHYLKTSRPVSSEWIGNISIVLLLLTCSLGSVYVSDCCNLCKFCRSLRSSWSHLLCYLQVSFFSFGSLVQLLCSFFNLWCLFLWEKYLNSDIIFILMLSTPLTTVMWLCLYIIVYN